MEVLKMLTTNEIVAQIVGFLILFFILRAFAWKRLLKLLDDRKERISSEFKKIEDDKAGIEKIKSDYDARLKSIEDTARSRIQEAIAEGQKVTQELKKNAQQEAEKIINDAKKNIEYEIEKAKEKLKDEVVDVVLNATGKLLEEKITAEKDKKIVKEFLEEIDQLK